MCGITGILAPAAFPFEPTLAAMAEALRHRGPDGKGIWADKESGIGFAHRRLSIVDLSPQGAQPMVSASGRFVLCYNGEIYNHLALRRDLKAATGIIWKGHSDTEVLLEAIERWGIRSTLERSNGMFAFAVWDRRQQTLTLARDRLGEKPLYVGQFGSVLAFASELKALRQLPGWRESVDRQALAELLRFGYIPAPRSIQAGVFKLPAASLITFRAADAAAPLALNDFSVRATKYWDLPAIAAAGAANPFAGNEEEISTQLEALLDDAVRLRMEADVPVGTMLSGGVDSSLVAALMQKASPRPIKTFTIGFGDRRFDEARHARLVAAHLGAEHTELHLTPEHALEAIPRLTDVYDEPFADPSQLPTLLVCEMARQKVTVALSGDGGDELFFGYRRYHDALRTWRHIGNWSAGSRHALATVIRAGSRIGGNMGFRLGRLGQRIDAVNFDAYYTNLLSLSPHPTTANWPNDLPGKPIFPPGFTAPGSRMMLADQLGYLPENILVKTDRASMAASLELRVPLIDHRLLEFAWQLPERYRWDGVNGKLLLRRLLYRLLPRELVDRPKQGFETPLDDWLRGPLREWVNDLLNPATLRAEGLLNATVVSALVTEHLSGRSNNGYALWPVLMFEVWRRRWE